MQFGEASCCRRNRTRGIKLAETALIKAYPPWEFVSGDANRGWLYKYRRKGSGASFSFHGTDLDPFQGFVKRKSRLGSSVFPLIGGHAGW